MRKRANDAMFGPFPAIEYSSVRMEDWASYNIAVMSEILRGAKALHFFTDSNYSPISSFTECEVLLDGVRIPTSTRDLYWGYYFSDYPEHVFYRMLYLRMVAQREKFIIIACSRFLEERQNSCSPPNPGLIQRLDEGINRSKDSLNILMKKFSQYKKHLSECYPKMPEDFKSHLQHVASEIVNLKKETAKSDYQWKEAVAKISKIVAATSRPLGFLRQGLGLPLEVTRLFEQLPPPENVYLKETSPYLALAGEYYLLLLWRCMQQLSLLVWFRSRYVIELLQENPSFTSEQVNGAITEMADKAEFSLLTFDAYEKAGRRTDGLLQTSELSDEEREQCLGLIVQGRNHLADTWNNIIGDEDMTYVNIAKTSIQNFHLSAAADSLASIQCVDGIPSKVHHLIFAYP
ncbi:hypothetical protein SeLEV6574_g08558, partial [Synchytrium endobioticum]